MAYATNTFNCLQHNNNPSEISNSPFGSDKRHIVYALVPNDDLSPKVVDLNVDHYFYLPSYHGLTSTVVCND